MREIKFRGITHTTKGEKWVFGYLYKVKSFFDEKYNYYIKDEHLQETIVDETTIGQYTGLKDKNGIEIYEGDILRNWGNEIEDWIVSYEYGKFSGEYDNVSVDLWDLSYLEVIGNIYEISEVEDESN